MAKNFLVPIDLNQLELQNFAVQTLANAPLNPTVGQTYFDTTLGFKRVWDGTEWQRDSGVDGSNQMPEDVSANNVASPGTSDEVSRADHVHDVETGAAGAASPGDVSTEGVSDALARADHTHAMDSWATSASSSEPGDTMSPGVADTFARGDHTHAREDYGTSTAQTTFGASKSDGTSTDVARADHTHGTPAHDDAAHSDVALDSLAPPNGPVDMGGQRVANVADPVEDSDAANKGYVDSVAQGLDAKGSVRVATTASISLTGIQTIDGVDVVVGDRVLVKNQTLASENGLYVVQALNWARTSDMNEGDEVPSAFTFVEEGNVNADSGWVVTTDAPVVLGTTPIEWTQFSGAADINAGDGLTKTGTTLDVGAGAGIVVNADDIEVDFATNVPLADGTASAGTVDRAAREDHVHPADPNKTGKYAATISGDGVQTMFAFTHNLGSRDTIAMVRQNAAPYAQVEVDIEATTTNQTTVRFAVAPSIGTNYRFIAVG